MASVAQGCLVCTASGVGVLGLRGCPRRLRSYALRTDLVARADPHSSHRRYRSRCRLIYRPRSQVRKCRVSAPDLVQRRCSTRRYIIACAGPPCNAIKRHIVAIESHGVAET